jgi:gluconolactonase
MAVDGHGHVYACDWHKDQVLRVDPVAGTWDVYTSGSPELRMDNPNSIVFADDGTMYVSGSENPAIFRVSPDGRTTVWSREPAGYPNGVALSPGGDSLFVAESHPVGGDGGKVWRIPISDDGDAGRAELVAELWHTVPDGFAFDADGGLLVAHYTPDRIDRIAPNGDVEIVAEDWEAVHLNAPTNIAFCGPDLAWLAVACVGEEFLAVAKDLGLRGMPLRYPLL